MCFTKAGENGVILGPHGEKLGLQTGKDGDIEILSSGKREKQAQINKKVLKLVSLGITSIEEYEILRRSGISDENIFEGFRVRSIKKGIKDKFDDIMNPKIKDKGDKL